MEFDYRLATPDWLDRLEGGMAETASQMKAEQLFVADDRESLQRHLEAQGRILMALSTGAKSDLAAFLIVRFPGSAVDNLGAYAGLDIHEQMRVAHMESVVVRPLYRGRGLQQKLVKRGEELARQLGYGCSMCTVSPDNLWSLANMQAAGYAIVATAPKYGGYLRHILLKRL